VDIETRRKKQQALMVRAMERKVRSRAQELYESRGQTAGQDLQDWFQAESELIEKSSLGSLYRRVKTSVSDASHEESGQEILPEQAACEAGA